MQVKDVNALKAVIAAAAVVTLAGACSSSGSGSGKTAGPASKPVANSAAPSGSTVTISLTGDRLTASDGRTLYYNTVDTTKKIDCVAGCATTWLPVRGKPAPGSGLDSGDFSTTSRPDGGMQVTYYGHPVYEFKGDRTAGDRNGDGIADGGGKWIVATPGQAAEKSATTSGSSASSPAKSSDAGGGGGYGYP